MSDEAELSIQRVRYDEIFNGKQIVGDARVTLRITNLAYLTGQGDVVKAEVTLDVEDLDLLISGLKRHRRDFDRFENNFERRGVRTMTAATVGQSATDDVIERKTKSKGPIIVTVDSRAKWGRRRFKLYAASRLVASHTGVAALVLVVARDPRRMQTSSIRLSWLQSYRTSALPRQTRSSSSGPSS
ncbi:hypothetical protein ACSMXN_21805 [Jatrophihabitans sp. DSM 45814]